MSQQTTFEDAAKLVVAHYRTHINVARVLGYTDLRNVSAWVNGLRPFPPEHCVTIDLDTKGSASPITRKQLRPDDWQKYWPELAPKTVKRANGYVGPSTRKA